LIDNDITIVLIEPEQNSAGCNTESSHQLPGAAQRRRPAATIAT
jgi:hypothetical protein